MPIRFSIRAAWRAPVTSGAILLSIVVSVLYWAGNHVEVLTMTDATFPAQPWRLLTCALPHVNALHLAFNVFWLWWFGALVESWFGHMRTAGIMALTGVAAHAAEYALFDGGIGLSGIVYGLFGLVWVLSAREERFRGVMSRNVVKLFIAWFFVCIFLTMTDIWPIANVAHAVGFLVGVLLGCTMTAAHGFRSRWSAVLGAVVLACVGSAALARPYINMSANRGWELARDGYHAIVAERYAAAMKLYEQALAMDPRQAEWWFNYAIASQGDNQFDVAIDAYERALAINPAIECRDALAYLHVKRACELRNHGKVDEALAECQRAVDVDPMYAPGWFYKGVFESERGQTVEARRSINNAIRLDPDQPHYSAKLAELSREDSRD